MSIKEHGSGLLLPGIAIAIGGCFVGQMMFNAKVAINTAAANLANWNIQYKVSGRSKKELKKLSKNRRTINESDEKNIADVLQSDIKNNLNLTLGLNEIGFSIPNYVNVFYCAQ